MEVKEKYPQITIDQFNRRKFRKRIKKAFLTFERVSKILRFEEDLSVYRETYTQIQEILFEDINKIQTYTHGNVYFLNGIVDVHIALLNNMLDRLFGIEDDGLLRMGYNVVIEKNKELLKILKQNREKPVTIDQLMEYAEEQENGQEDSEEVGIGHQ